MIPVGETDRIYRLCVRHKLTRHAVDHSVFRAFSSAVGQLIRSLGDVGQDDDWVEFVRASRRYRFDLAAAPVPFCDPSLAPRVGLNWLRQFAASTSFTFPRFAGLASEIIGLLTTLTGSNENPLLDAITDEVRLAGAYNVAVLLAANRLVAPAQRVLAARAETRGIDVITANELRSTERYDWLLVLGARRWFPDFIWTAPRSPNIYIVSYGWIRDDWQPEAVFLSASVGQSVRHQSVVIGQDDGASEDITPDVDWTTIEREWSGKTDEPRDPYAPDVVEARLHLLYGGFAVFLEVSDRRTIMVVDPEADEHNRVRQVSDGDVEPGMFVVLRNDNSGDYLLPVANRILGAHAEPYRAGLTLWKKLLRDDVARRGLFETCIELLDRGSSRADENNLRNWMSDRNIAPQKREDFAAITEVVGLGKYTDRLWSEALRIRSAHLRAGVMIRRSLVEKVKLVKVIDLEREGRLDFELSEAEGGRLAAIRIEARSNSTVTLPISRVEHVISPRELGA